MGHVNNAVYWQAVEEGIAAAGIDGRGPLRARLDHRHAVDLGDAVQVVAAREDGALALAFVVDGVARAVGRVEQLSAVS